MAGAKPKLGFSVFLLESYPSPLLMKLLPVDLLKEFRAQNVKGRMKGPGGALEPVEFFQTRILPEIFVAISKVDAFEFDKLIEELLTYVLVNWMDSQCFESILIVGQIFGYISSVAPKAVVNELLISFSKEDVPPQVKYFLLPEIAKHVKHPVKQVIPDPTLYHMIYFMRMNKTQLNTLATASVDAKFVRPFWIQLQHKWSDSVAASLVPVFVQMVDIIPNLNDETLCEVKKAMSLQFSDEDDHNVPTQTLLAVTILLLGFSQLEKAGQIEWPKLCQLSATIFKHCSRHGPGFQDEVSALRHLRSFIVQLLCSSLFDVHLVSDEKLNDLIRAIPHTNGFKMSPPEVNTQESPGPASSSSVKSIVDELEDLTKKLTEIKSLSLTSNDKVRLQRATALLHDWTKSEQLEPETLNCK